MTAANNGVKNKNYVFRNPAKTIKEMVALATAKFPGNYAFKRKVNGKIEAVTFEEMTKHVENLGTEILAMGLPKLRVGIIGDNSYEWFQVFLATVNGGGVGVPFDKGLTAEELATCINRSGIEALFHDEAHAEVVKNAIALSDKKDLKTFEMKGKHEVLESLKSAGARKVQEGNTAFADAVVNPDDLCVILFTSGTTANSKAVMLSHINIMSNIKGMHVHEHMYPWDVNMAFLPAHHSFGLVGVLVYMAAGACSVFCDGLRYISKNLAEYHVTVFVGVPLLIESMYKKVLQTIKKEGKEDTVKFGKNLCSVLDKVGIKVRRKIFKSVIDGLGGSLHLIISGAAPLNKEVAEGFNAFGIDLIQGYGLTETSPVLAAERPEDLCMGSVGKPLPNVELKIDEPDENGIGEIIARGPNVMMGYMDQPEETAAVIIDGWFHTGDLGRIDEKGNFWITGRKKNVIVMKNGKNIFPEEYESLVADLPYVVDNMMFTRDKHNELVLWEKIVYSPEYLEAEGLSFDAFVEQVKKDLETINESMPMYKNVHHFILSDEPMIMTTTNKVKRVPEQKRIDETWDTITQYTVEK